MPLNFLSELLKLHHHDGDALLSAEWGYFRWHGNTLHQGCTWSLIPPRSYWKNEKHRIKQHVCVIKLN